MVTVKVTSGAFECRTGRKSIRLAAGEHARLDLGRAQLTVARKGKAGRCSVSGEAALTVRVDDGDPEKVREFDFPADAQRVVVRGT